MNMSRRNVLFIQLLIAVICFTGNFFYFGSSVAAASVIETQIDGDFDDAIMKRINPIMRRKKLEKIRKNIN